MSLARTVPLVLLVLGATVVTSLGLYSRQKAIEPIRFEPLKLPLRLPSNGFLESQIAELAASEADRAGNAPFPIEEGGDARSATEAAAVPSEGLDNEGSDEEGHLRRVAQEFAYTRYGKVGAIGVATLLDLRSYETTTTSEGSSYRGLAIAQVEENSILLTYPGEGELRKPRIELEVEPLTSDGAGPEKAEAIWTRHRELWGNRTEGGLRETSFSPSTAPPSPDEIERRQAARKRYLEKMSDFQHRLQAEDPSLDPRDSPLLPTAEEVARESLQKTQGAWEADDAHSGGVDSPQGADQP